MPDTTTLVTTKTSTGTKVVIGVLAALALGFAAYGFGFLPMLQQKAAAPAAPSCLDTCYNTDKICRSQDKPDVCDQNLKLCMNGCPTQTAAQPAAQPAYQPTCTDTCQNNDKICRSQNKPDVCDQQLSDCNKYCQPAPAVQPQPAVADCTKNCDYDMAKCGTYSTAAICQNQWQNCVIQCGGTPGTPPTSGTASSSASGTSTGATVPAGTLIVEPYNQRVSTILVAGGDAWQNVAQYRAVAGSEEVVIDRLAVRLAVGVSDSVSQVGIWKDGALIGFNVFPTGIQTADIDLSSNPIRVPAGGTAIFQVVARLANVQASSAVGSINIINGRRQIAVELGHDLGSVSWGAVYAGKYDVHARGSASGADLYAAYATAVPSTFIIRRSKPVITPQTLPTHTLSGATDQNLIKFQVTADPAGAVALKKMTFRLTMVHAASSTYALNNFRLRRGMSDVPLTDVRIVNAGGMDITGTSSSVAGTDATVVVSFRNEDVVTGSGNLYTLHAFVNGMVAPGDKLITAFNRSVSGGAETGYLTMDGARAAVGTLPGPHLDASIVADDTTDYTTGFLWSDLSEVPHVAQPGRSGGSYDWALDGLLDNLNVAETLMR